jgi:ABC-type transporter Mla subunit MlaD
MNAHRLRYSIYGVTFVVGLIAAAALTVAQFNRVFTATTALQLRAPRAGLLLTSGSAVKMRAVTDLGRCRHRTRDHARRDAADPA